MVSCCGSDSSEQAAASSDSDKSRDAVPSSSDFSCDSSSDSSNELLDSCKDSPVIQNQDQYSEAIHDKDKSKNHIEAQSSTISQTHGDNARDSSQERVLTANLDGHMKTQELEELVDDPREARLSASPQGQPALRPSYSPPKTTQRYRQGYLLCISFISWLSCHSHSPPPLF